MVDLKSMWSPKFPGLELVTKNCALSGTEWNPFNFLLALSLYSLMRPNEFLSSKLLNFITFCERGEVCKFLRNHWIEKKSINI
jgi:hypothetical protein